MAEQHLIGVISDTHIPHRLRAMPGCVYEMLHGCDVILHVGDLEDLDILDPLSKIAPVYAVRGNVHWQSSTGTHDQDLPSTVTLPVDGHVVYMNHGHINFAHTMIDKFIHFGTRPTPDQVNQIIIERLARVKPSEADIVVFGHTHRQFGEWIDGTFYFNPGAVCRTIRPPSRSSIGRLHLLSDGSIAPEWLFLDEDEL